MPGDTPSIAPLKLKMGQNTVPLRALYRGLGSKATVILWRGLEKPRSRNSLAHWETLGFPLIQWPGTRCAPCSHSWAPSCRLQPRYLHWALREGKKEGTPSPHYSAPGVLWPAWLWVGEKVPSRGGRAQLQPKTRTQERGVGKELGAGGRGCENSEKRRVEEEGGHIQYATEIFQLHKHHELYKLQHRSRT